MDMENVKCTLNNIVTTLGLILEDMGEEHAASDGCEKAFYTRVDDVYLPALDLVQESAVNLLKGMEVTA